jgi:hypothetical protein
MRNCHRSVPQQSESDESLFPAIDFRAARDPGVSEIDSHKPTYQYKPGPAGPDYPIGRSASFALGTCLPVRLWGIHPRIIIDLGLEVVEVATAQVSDYWRR